MCPQVNGMKECYAGAQDTEFRSFYGSAVVEDFGAALRLTLLSKSRIKSATFPRCVAKSQTLVVETARGLSETHRYGA
jgi:hypothetical protein